MKYGCTDYKKLYYLRKIIILIKLTSICNNNTDFAIEIR